MSFCVKCNNPAKLMCSRCYEPYCGLSCQINDWLIHKRVCRPMPGLVSIDTVFQTMKSEKVYVKCEKETLHVSSSNDEILSDMSNIPMGKNESCVKATDDDPEFKKKKSPVSRLQSIEKDDRSSRRTVSKQDLAILEDSTEIYGVKETENISPSTSTSTCGTLRPIKNSKYFLNDLKVIPIREGKNISVVVTDTSFIENMVIAALDYENKARSEMNRNLKSLAEYCKLAGKHGKRYDPEYNEICLAVFDEDGEWYRAYVIKDKSVGDIYTVQFIDYGNVANVSKDNIMPITEEFMFPTCTSLCRITNLGEEDLPKFKAYISTNGLLNCDVHYNREMDIYELAVHKNNILLK